MEKRDSRILKHLGLYGLSLRPTLERLFFGGAACGNVLQRLRDDGYIEARERGLPGNITYYQLTSAAADQLDLPLSRSTPLKPQALHKHLAILWFCCMQETRRYRLEEEALQRLFPNSPPNGDHCVEDTPERKRIYEVYVPGPNARLRSIVRRVRSRFYEVVLNPDVEPWLKAHTYALAVLVETPERRAAIRTTLKNTLEGDKPLTGHAYIRTEVVPGLKTIASAFRELQK